MMTINEHRAACLLNFSTWITVCIAGLGIACNICRLFEHGMGKLNIWASLLLAGYFFYNGLLILKRNDDGRKNIIFACYLLVGILLFLMEVTFYQTGTFFPNSAGKIHMAAFFLLLGWNLWMLLLLHHPAVKRCFFPELELPENYQCNTIPVGLAVAFVVIACNLFIVAFVGLFVWASMENHDARGFLLFVNSTVFSIPAIFCFIIYKDYWEILLLAVLVGTTAFFGPLLIA